MHQLFRQHKSLATVVEKLLQQSPLPSRQSLVLVVYKFFWMEGGKILRFCTLAFLLELLHSHKMLKLE